MRGDNTIWDVMMWVLLLVIFIVLYVDSIRGVKDCTPKEVGCEHEANSEVVQVIEIKADVEPAQELQEIVCEPMTEEQLAEEEYYDSLEILAICVEAEAGNQGLMGKRLVADVILNRVESSKFPNDINSVIADKNQFSSYTDGGMDRVWEPSEETFQAVQMELENRTDSNILYFTAGEYNPYCIPAYVYKDHYFGL